MIFNLYKQRGETPLECLERFRITYPEHKDEKMTYLGRLDPMAEGVLLVATGEDIKQSRREEFFELDKDYEFVALFGFATDTYDCLGKIVKTADFAKGYVEPKEMDLIKICKLYEGEREQKYPPYSSKVQAWNSLEDAHQGEIKKVTIYKMQFKGLETLKLKELFGRLLMDISKVKGDFRQTKILEGWKEKMEKSKNEKFLIARFSASVSSCTYIRSIVNDMGTTLGIGACALSIKRTRVGNYLLKDSLSF